MHSGTQFRLAPLVALLLTVALPGVARAIPIPGEPICTSTPCGERCCDGTICEELPFDAGVVCRPSAGDCDVAEVCDGVSLACPTNGFVPQGTTCRAANGVCDAAEVCTGSSASCPADVMKPGGTVCRTAAGTCDETETCTGTSNLCPADTKKPAGVVCRDAAGACDVAETCNGTSAACPADAFQGHGAVCRGIAGACDVEEVCSGTGPQCPPDALEPSTFECRAAAGACDAAEHCTGTGAHCPADALLPAGSVCRAAASACDQAETCSGASTTCPSDAIFPDGSACGDVSACMSGGTCTAGVCFGGTAELSFTPEEAVVKAGQTTSLTVTHSGSGGALTVTEATLDSEAFELVDVPEWPVSLSTGESLTVGVRLAAATPGSHAATVSLAVDGCESLTAAVSAEIAPPPASDGGGGGGCGTPVGSAPSALAWVFSVIVGLRALRRSRR